MRNPACSGGAPETSSDVRHRRFILVDIRAGEYPPVVPDLAAWTESERARLESFDRDQLQAELAKVIEAGDLPRDYLEGVGFQPTITAEQLLELGKRYNKKAGLDPRPSFRLDAVKIAAAKKSE